MLICENYLLMILDESKGSYYVKTAIVKELCLAGAVLMDLILRKKILIEKKYVRVIDVNTTGDEYLDEILGVLDSSKKLRKVKSWIDFLSRKYVFWHVFLKRLENQGILKIKEKSFLKVFRKTSFSFPVLPEVKLSLMKQIHKVLVENVEPDIELLCLISLLRFGRIINMYVSKGDRGLAKFRINALIQNQKNDPEHVEMILKIEKAIKSVTADRGATLPWIP
ncbi:MAG: GPP34 family phosphoprotein [Candidatus Hodarchaeota archaeon]